MVNDGRYEEELQEVEQVLCDLRKIYPDWQFAGRRRGTRIILEVPALKDILSEGFAVGLGEVLDLV